MSKTLINNVIFVVDDSGSMSYHARSVEKVIQGLKDPLSQADQVTRVSLYTFNSTVQRKLHLRHPDSLSDFKFSPSGQTALLDAVDQAIREHQNLLTGADEDHSFLLYAITDGETNADRKTNAYNLKNLIAGLNQNWTVAALVPNISGVHYAKNCGFPAGNIEVWNTSSQRGFEEVGQRLVDTYKSYSAVRSAGGTGSTRLFVDTKNLSVTDVQKTLAEDSSFRKYAVTSTKAEPIREYTEAVTGRGYILGSVYYQLTKPETIQGNKLLAISNKQTGKVYSGPAARQVLGLPNYETNVRPGDFGDWEIYIQSTSVNRKLIPGQNFLMKMM
jgi:hypothetical protein